MKIIRNLSLLTIGFYCLFISAVAECAIVADPGLMGMTVSKESMKGLAMVLAQGLNEKVEVVQVDGYIQMEEYLNRYAIMDLGLIDNTFLQGQLGEYVLLGAVDRAGEIILVGRQGVSAELTEKVIKILREKNNVLLFEPEKQQEIATKSIKADQQQPVQNSKPQAGTKDYGLIIVQGYHKYLGREPDPGGYDYWIGQLKSGAVTEQQFELELCKASGKKDCM